MTNKQIRYLRIGSLKVPMIELMETAQGDQYIIFPFHGGGFHLSAHPDAHPHLKDNAGVYQELDLEALRKIDWDLEAEKFAAVWKASFYWPQHQADLLAFPGPPGKSWVDAFLQATQSPDFNVLEVLKVILGSGRAYKVGYRERGAFFKTTMGKGAAILDKKDECFAIFVATNLEKPLFRVGGPASSFPFIFPEPLQRWSDTIDRQIEVGFDEKPSRHVAKIETSFEEILPEIEKFLRNFKILRWKPGRGAER